METLTASLVVASKSLPIFALINGAKNSSVFYYTHYKWGLNKTSLKINESNEQTDLEKAFQLKWQKRKRFKLTTRM